MTRGKTPHGEWFDWAVLAVCFLVIVGVGAAAIIGNWQ